jgi:hypothetical protein
MRIKESATGMLSRYQQIDNLFELRDYVYETLCEYNQLQLGAYEMTEDTLFRAGRPCGIYFCVYGPRKMKATAIWETDRNQVLFYDSSGQRFQKTVLTDAPRLELSAA